MATKQLAKGSTNFLKSRLSSVQLSPSQDFNVGSTLFQRCGSTRTQRCFNVDLTLCDVATSYQPKSNVEPTLKCLLGCFPDYEPLRFKPARQLEQFKQTSVTSLFILIVVVSAAILITIFRNLLMLQYNSDLSKVKRNLVSCITNSLREKCPNTEFFSGPYFPAFGLNTERQCGFYANPQLKKCRLHHLKLENTTFQK